MLHPQNLDAHITLFQKDPNMEDTRELNRKGKRVVVTVV